MIRSCAKLDFIFIILCPYQSVLLRLTKCLRSTLHIPVHYKLPVFYGIAAPPGSTDTRIFSSTISFIECSWFFNAIYVALPIWFSSTFYLIIFSLFHFICCWLTHVVSSYVLHFFKSRIQLHFCATPWILISTFENTHDSI